MKDQKFPKVTILIIVLLCVVSFLSYFLGYSMKTTSPSHGTNGIQVLSPTPNKSSSAVTPVQPLSFSGYNEPLRHFDALGYFFSSFSYPPELRNITNSQITTMSCTNVDASDLPRYKNDPNYSSVLESLLKKASVISYCIGSDGTKVAEYETDTEAVITAILSKTTSSEIGKFNATYMTCEPILLTKTKLLYYECHGGDTREHADIYKVDIVKKTITDIYSCVSGSPAVSPEPPKCVSYPKAAL